MMPKTSGLFPSKSLTKKLSYGPLEKTRMARLELAPKETRSFPDPFSGCSKTVSRLRASAVAVIIRQLCQKLAMFSFADRTCTAS